MFRRFIEKHPYFFDQFRRIAGKVALGALLLYGCGLLIVWGFQMGPLSIVMFVYVLWLLIEFIPDILLPSRSHKNRLSIFENILEKSGESVLTLRQLIWKIVFMVAALYTCIVILIGGFTSELGAIKFISFVVAVPILGVFLSRIIKTIRRYLAARNKKVPLDEAAQRELTRLEELYRAGIYSQREFTAKKAQLLKKAAENPKQTFQQK